MSRLQNDQNASELIIFLESKIVLYIYFIFSLTNIVPSPRVNNGNNDIVDLTLSDDEGNDISSQSAIDQTILSCRLRRNRTPKPGTPTPLKTVPATLVPPFKNGIDPDLASENIQITDVNHQLITSAQLKTSLSEVILKVPRVKLTKINAVDPECERDTNSQTQELSDSRPTGRYEFRSRVPRKVDLPIENKTKPAKRERKKPLTLEQSREWSTCEVARQFDMLHNFFPEPGPSHVNYYEKMELSGYYGPIDVSAKSGSAIRSDETTQCKTKVAAKIGPKSKTTAKPASKKQSETVVIAALLRSPTFDEVLDTMPAYDIAYGNQTDQENIELLDEFKGDLVTLNRGWLSQTAICNSNGVFLNAILAAPSFDEVLAGMVDYDLPFCTPSEPFYGNSNDATARKEISHSTVLHIPTQTLKDTEAFTSDLVSDHGFVAIQNELYKAFTGSEKLVAQAEIRRTLATTDPSVLSTITAAPSYGAADRWLWSIGTVSGSDEEPVIIDVDSDSPIQVHRETPMMAIGEDAGVEIDMVVSLSPLTPTRDKSPPLKNIEKSPPSPPSPPRIGPLRRTRATYRNVKNVQPREQLPNSPWPSIFNHNGSPDDRTNGGSSPIVIADDVICLDDDDEEVVREEMEASQLFTKKPFAKDLARDANVLVSKC